MMMQLLNGDERAVPSGRLDKAKRSLPALALGLVVLLAIGNIVGRENNASSSSTTTEMIDEMNHEMQLLNRQLSEVESTIDISDSDSDNENNGPSFIFVIGLEGTGHHLLHALLSKSPTMNSLNQFKMCSAKSSLLGQLSTQFFHESNHKSHVGQLGFFNPGSYGNEFDANGKYNVIVRLLRDVKAKFLMGQQIKQFKQQQEHKEKEDEGPFNIAINANGCHADSMMSYPTFMNPADRPIDNVNLDIFYNACTDANVQCNHIYIYRDPYAVLKSTTMNRDYNHHNIVESLRLYTSIAQGVHSQLISHADKSLGCFGLLDSKGYANTEDWERLGKLFGWKTHEEFDTVLKSVMGTKVPVEMLDEHKEKLVPKERLGVLMKAFEDIHNRVVDFCYESLKENDDKKKELTLMDIVKEGSIE